MSHSDEPRNPHRRRTTPRAARAPSWSAGDHPDAVDGPFVIERLTALSHDLINLLDGSMRCLALARRSIGAEITQLTSDRVEETRRQVDTVYSALERMAELVHGAMRGTTSAIGAGAAGRAITLQEAIVHAARVLAPVALELKTRIDVSFADELAALPAGPLYTVMLNGLRNAVESIGRVPESARRDGGRVQVIAVARSSPGSNRKYVILEVLDDGAGIRSAAAGARAFQIGTPGKNGGMGVGLAMARDLVRQVSGTIELRPRPDIADRVRPGAVLRILYPFPREARRPGKRGGS